MSADPIRQAVDQLAVRLPGHGRLRRSILREVEDCLRDAAEDHLAEGLDRDAARVSAVRQFGDLDDAAAEYRIELAAAATRHTALLIAIGYPAMLVPWALLGKVFPTHNGQSAPSWINGSFTWIAVTSLVMAIALLVRLRVRARSAGAFPTLMNALAALGLGSATLTGVAGYLSSSLSTATTPGAVGAICELGTEIVSALFVAALGVSAARCLVHRRRVFPTAGRPEHVT
jgi:hypothetical protein